MLVRVQLIRIIIVDSEDEKASMVVLREVEGERQFPIMIGVNEAYAIDRRTKGQVMHRPLTHDLIHSLMEGLDGRLEQVVIHDLRESTFYAKLLIRQDGRLVEVDSRPSDALAISAGTETPIFVEEAVLNEVC